MQRWRLLEYSSKNPAINLALEEAILRYLLKYDGPNTICLWQNPPSVIVGYFQNPKDVVDLAACRKLGINVVRRISGGGAVYHDYGNINYSIFVKKNSLKDPLRAIVEDVEKSYNVFCRGIIEGLKALGIEARNLKGSITVKGRKISGSAQHRLYNAILHHGTIMANVNMETLGKVLRISNPEETLINLYEALPNEISLDKIKNTLKNGFKKTFNIELFKGLLSPKEIYIAKNLYKIKYGQKWWNMNEKE
jgi:lipoate-protein ligase A